MSALKTHHGLCLIREQVDYLALAFVSPLRTDDYNVLSHDKYSQKCCLNDNLIC
jgi:hypothetical protein